MMKFLLTIITLSFTIVSHSQMSEVKFREQSFANGMNYPQVVIPASKISEDSINADIRRRIADLEKSDFCIGQYGYVQKATHIQIHIYCNCIDFAESQNRYFFYDLESGKHVPYINVFNPQQAEGAKHYIIEKVKAFAKSNSLTLSSELLQSMLDNSLDAFEIELNRDVIRLMHKEFGDKKLELTWVELKPYLKYHFM